MMHISVAKSLVGAKTLVQCGGLQLPSFMETCVKLQQLSLIHMDMRSERQNIPAGGMETGPASLRRWYRSCVWEPWASKNVFTLLMSLN